MKPTYYSAAWTDSGCFLSCSHEHETIVEAAACIKCAGGYVVGVENGVMRSLSRMEESEFQSAIRDPSKYPAPHISAPVPERTSSGSGYAVMTRIRLVDGWSWATWMCFATHAQAVACARKGDRVVRFSSDEWSALKQEKSLETAQTDHGAQESLDPRAEGELLVQFVLRLLTALDPAGFLSPECQSHTVRTILSRLSDSEIRKLKILSQTDIPALLEALQLLPTVIDDGRRQ